MEGSLKTIDNPSLSAHGYQLFSLAASQLVHKNMKFDISCIFSPVLLIVGGGELAAIKDPSLSVHGY